MPKVRINEESFVVENVGGRNVEVHHAAKDTYKF